MTRPRSIAPGWRRRAPRLRPRAAIVQLICAAIAAAPLAAAATPDGAPGAAAAPARWAIPAGQEEALRAALKPADGLGGGWRLDSARIDKEQVVVTLAHDGGARWQWRLVHPSVASATARSAGPFAVEAPAAPAGADPDAAAQVVARLLAGLQTLQGRWQWVRLKGSYGRNPQVPEDRDAKAHIVDLFLRARHEVDAGDARRARALVEQARAAPWPGQAERPPWVELDAGSVLLSLGDVGPGREAVTSALAATEQQLAQRRLDPAQTLAMEVLRARALVLLGRQQDADAAIAALQQRALTPLAGDAAVVPGPEGAAAPAAATPSAAVDAPLAATPALDVAATALTPGQRARVCDLAWVGATLGADAASFARGAALLEWILGRTPTCRRAYLALAESCRKNKQFDRAGPLLEQGARLLPTDAGVVSQLANYYKFKDRRPEAIALLENLARAGHAEPGLLGELLGLYTRAGIPQEALAMFRAKADADPSDDVSAFFSGVLLHYVIKGEKELRDPTTPADAFDVSNTYLRRARASFGDEPRLFIYLAMNRYHVGDLAQAASYIAEGIRIGPSDPDVYYCRALIHMDQNPAQALEDFSRYRTLTRDAFDKNPGKEQFVLGVIDDLQACVHARVPGECFAQRRTVQRWGPWGYALAGAALLLGLVAVWWRRRRGALAALGAFVTLTAAVASAPAPAYADASPADLLRQPDGSPWQPQPPWTSVEVQRQPDQVTFVVRAADGRRVTVDLVAAGREDRSLRRTRSFDISHRGDIGGDARAKAEAWRLVETIADLVAANDHGQIALQRSVVPRIGPDVPHTLEAQWSWLEAPDKVQITISAALLIASLFF